MPAYRVISTYDATRTYLVPLDVNHELAVQDCIAVVVLGSILMREHETPILIELLLAVDLAKSTSEVSDPGSSRRRETETYEEDLLPFRRGDDQDQYSYSVGLFADPKTAR